MGTNGNRSLIGFAVFLTIWMVAGPASWASAQTPIDPSRKTAVESADMVYISTSLKKLLKEGYAIDGPTEVVKVAATSVTLFTGKAPNRNWTVDLSGKTVLIKDYQGNTVSLSSIQPKMKIYTCRKADNVTILVMAKKEARNDQ